MKKAADPKPSPPEDDLARYDWSKASRGRFAGTLATGTPWRRLDEELATAFPTSDEVNEALRALLALRAVLEPKRKRRAA